MILVTGSSGFVGQALTKILLHTGHDVRGVARTSTKGLAEPNFEFVPIDDFSKVANWQTLLANVDTIVHTIARVHIMDDKVINPLDEFRKLNVQATINLAAQAAAKGVKRFVFISSIKVNGESTQDEKPFLETDNTVPSDPYGLSKLEAEQGLLAIAEQTKMEVVIIRPPLIYGPEVKANFANMMRWVKLGVPLPFGNVGNKRSLIALENLIDFIIRCIEHPRAANEIFLISDGQAVSTTELMQKVAKAFGKKERLIPIPVSLMKFTASLLGKQALAIRLFGSLEVDSTKARNLLDWQPVITIDEQLKKMAEVF
jgi:nucleoside-diphosphate-sugar epimerase